MALVMAAAGLVARGQTNAPAVGMTLLPENVPWTLGWDKMEAGEEIVAFRLYATQTFTNRVTQHATLGAVTNRVWQWPTNAVVEIRTFQAGTNNMAALVPGLTRGTNAVALSAVDALTNESELSEPLILRVLGKPLAPQGIRKL